MAPLITHNVDATKRHGANAPLAPITGWVCVCCVHVNRWIKDGCSLARCFYRADRRHTWPEHDEGLAPSAQRNARSGRPRTDETEILARGSRCHRWRLPPEAIRCDNPLSSGWLDRSARWLRGLLVLPVQTAQFMLDHHGVSCSMGLNPLPVARMHIESTDPAPAESCIEAWCCDALSNATAHSAQRQLARSRRQLADVHGTKRFLVPFLT